MEPKVIKQSNEEQREIRKRVLSLLVKKDLYKKREQEYKQEAQEVNHLVKVFLEKNGNKKGIIETKEEKISLCVVEPSSIIWDMEKLQKQLGKKLSDVVFNKQVTITNYNAVVELLKKYGVPAKEFTQFLTVKKEVNQEAIDNLFQLGKISKKDIKGCYTVKKGTAYVKLTKGEKKE